MSELHSFVHAFSNSGCLVNWIVSRRKR